MSNKKEKMEMVNRALDDYDEARCALIEENIPLSRKEEKFDELFLNYCRKVRAVLELK
jgi:hypothetical protein